MKRMFAVAGRLALSLAAAICAAQGAFAANQNSSWQTAGGGDMATSSNWSLGETTYWADTQSSGNWVCATFLPIPPYDPLTFTASSDLSFAELYFHAGSAYHYQEYVLDPGADRTIYLNGTGDAAVWLGVNSGKGALVRFKSGTYKLREGATGGNTSFRQTTTGGGVTSVVESASARLEFDKVNFSGYLGNLLCVTNGGYMRGALTIGGAGATLRDGGILVSGRDPTTGESSIFDENNGNALAFDVDSNGGEVTLLVNDGGVVTNFYGRWGNRGSNAKMIIDGGYYYGSTSGSLTLGNARTTVKDSDVVTGWPTNNSVTVRNGGVFTMPDGKVITVGAQGSGHSVTVESGAEMNVETIYLGTNADTYQDDKNCSNRLVVASGAHLNLYTSLACKRTSFGHEIDIGGEGTRVDIRKDALGNAGGGITLYASNTVVRIHDGAVVTNLEKSAGTRIDGENVLLEVLSGAELYVANGMQQGFSAAVSNIFVRVEDGGRIVTETKTAYQVGNTNQGSDADWNTTLWVGTDGVLDTYYLKCFGYGNSFVISNGTVNVGFEFRTTYNNNEETGGRTRMTFAGTKPRFVVNGQYCNFYRNPTIRFEIPAGGYTTIPFEQTVANNYGIAPVPSGVAMEFDVEAYRKSGGGTVTLMKSVSPLMDAATLESLQSSVPEKCSLVLAENNTELRLTVKPESGLTIIFR